MNPNHRTGAGVSPQTPAPQFRPLPHQPFVGKAAAWTVGSWVLALGAFALAAVLSYREIHYNIPNDLRSPGILVANALLAAAVAFGYAWRSGSSTRWTEAHLFLRFGLWSAAVFRLVPPMLNEDVLYLKNCGTFDLPYVVLGACLHGALVALLLYPASIRLLKLPQWTHAESLWRLCGAVVLVLLTTACTVRLFLAEKWWLG